MTTTEPVDRGAIEALVTRWTKDGIGEGRLTVFDELVAEDALDRSSDPAIRGPESFKARAAAVRRAFADIAIAVEDLVVEGDAVAWRWSLTGTHIGAFAGCEPSGRRVTLRGVNFQRVRAGRVVDHWTMVDVFGAVQAITRRS